MENSLTPFEGKPIRSIEHEGEMWFSVVDIIAALTDSVAPKKYWSALKRKESQLSMIYRPLKLEGKDSKKYLTDCSNTEGVLRIIQSVSSPKAEPFKMWLASLGKRELDEIADPELLSERQAEIYRAKGRSEEWITRRMESIKTRKRLTDEWKNRGVAEGEEYSILTATISKGTFGIAPSEHGKLKGLKKENLRDHMTPLELVFVALGEEVTRMTAIDDNAHGFQDNHDAATKGGYLAGEARKNLESNMGKKVVSPANFLNLGKDEIKPDELPEGEPKEQNLD
jgi:DNA-damage-inducible protein D